MCGVPAEHFPPSFQRSSDLSEVSIVDQPEGHHSEGWRKGGSWVPGAACCSRAQGSCSHLCCTARTAAVRANLPEGPRAGVHPSVMGSIHLWWPQGCDLSQLLCLRLDMIHPSSTTLPSTLPPQPPPQAPWLSHSSGFSASFPPETGIRRRGGGSSSGWLPLRKRQLRVTFSKSSPCPSLSHLVVHQAGPLSWGRLCHWLSPTREDIRKAWNLRVEGFPRGSHLWSCAGRPSLQLPALRAVVFLEVCEELFATGLIHSSRNQIGFGSDPVRGLYCISACRNTKEQSLVICSIISSSVP